MIFLSFSDSAKFADVARNLISGLGYGDSFTFWGISVFNYLKQNTFPVSIPPVMPFSIAVFFKIFGISDLAVIAASSFYFLLTLPFVYMLAKKIFKNSLTSILSTVAVGFNYNLINYATGGASESPFIFEIVAASYFILLKEKWATIVGFFLLVLMYFTRQQAFIYIAGLILFYLLSRFKTKKAVLSFIGISIAALLFDRYVLYSLTGKYFLYSIFESGLNVGRGYLSGSATSDSLRGGLLLGISTISIFKKVFYNLYNFYKLLPEIINPYLFTLFLVGLFRWGKDRVENSFKVSIVFMTIVAFLVVAASIPFFRYIHPIIVFVYIVAIGALVDILSQVFRRRTLILISSFLVLFFSVGQTLGIFLLDSRFEKNTHNVGKPPVYVQLSYLLRDNTSNNQIIITNLDTWGSWYGERKTVWFPLKPKQIINPATGKIPFDAIYLTSYLIDDENYYMGADWREIFDNPTDPKRWVCDGCGQIANEFKLKGVYRVAATEDYERQDAYAVLLIKN